MYSHPTSKYDVFSMDTLADAICTNDYSAQEAVMPEHTNSYIINNFNTLKTIDCDNVDIITIAYGTNDYAGGILLSEFISATKYSIEKIKATYPDIQIVLCTPIYRMLNRDDAFVSGETYKPNGYALPELCNAIKDIGNEYNLLVIDNYNNSGINSSNWSDYTIDGSHPNTTGHQMIAENMAKELYNKFG